MLHEFITSNRVEIIARCRAKISSRPAPRATDAELEYGVPLFLTQLCETLQLVGGSNPAILDTATRHAGDLLARGFSVAQVVQDYGGVCQAITELVGETQVEITAGEFQALNACLDEAIAGAVTEYARLREHEGTERMGRLAHELRNHLNSALLSYEMLKMGTVGIVSSTGAVLGRSLVGLRGLIDRELAEVRLGAGIYQRETIVVFDLIEDLEVAASMEANARGLQFSIVGLPRDVTVEADRPIVEAVVANLLQNAFKFTRPHGHITLRARVASDRVLIDVEDQCGGLPPGKVDELFRPFEQRAVDRRGLGLGLEICARGARVNGGVIRVVDHPGIGCVFTLDLPLTGAREAG
jgi:signal transduction histidine kinase